MIRNDGRETELIVREVLKKGCYSASPQEGAGLQRSVKPAPLQTNESSPTSLFVYRSILNTSKGFPETNACMKMIRDNHFLVILKNSEREKPNSVCALFRFALSNVCFWLLLSYFAVLLWHKTHEWISKSAMEKCNFGLRNRKPRCAKIFRIIDQIYHLFIWFACIYISQQLFFLEPIWQHSENTMRIQEWEFSDWEYSENTNWYLIYT